jgi:hypothetical protein
VSIVRGGGLREILRVLWESDEDEEVSIVWGSAFPGIPVLHGLREYSSWGWGR